MSRKFHHYIVWEDWPDGLYRQSRADLDRVIVSRAARLLSDPQRLLVAMRKIVERWPHAAEQNLSHRGRNRQAYLGQAACCYVCGACEDETKEAWHTLTAAEKDAANGVADIVISEWDSTNA